MSAFFSNLHAINSFSVMKKLLLIFGSVLLLNLSAQEPDQIIVPARTKVADCFPPAVRYLYPGFSSGQVILHNGNHNSASLNYNFLFGEMEFTVFQFNQGSSCLSTEEMY